MRLTARHACTGIAALALLAGCAGTRDAGGSSPAAVTPWAAAGRPCTRPYSPRSPWNTPIPPGVAYASASNQRVRAIGSELTSDPTQYTYPVYRVSSSTPRRPVRVAGVFSDVSAGGQRLQVRHGVTLNLPVPPGAAAAAGSDAQIVIVNRSTGDEWGAWELSRTGRSYSAENGYHYNTHWSGVPPRSPDGSPFGSRGAGVPYLAGLVRACEIARGHIDHALAFAYNQPSRRHVYPATKSDGHGRGLGALPEGTRLRLDPGISFAQLQAWGCTGACVIAARALQRYGMYVIDSSGHAKVIFEYEGTAHWGGRVGPGTVTPIPLSAFRVLR